MATPASILFAVSNELGANLAKLVEARAAGWGVSHTTVRGATWKDFASAAASGAIVIFDASVEEGHNYDAATPQPIVSDHILVVSRTHLPLNFYGLREGGVPLYPQTRTNGEIVNWLDGQIAELKAARADGAKESLRLQEERWKSSGAIFISFRSHSVDAVAALARKVRDERGQFVRWYPPGQLAFGTELMTEMQRWSIVTSIDRRLAAANELWIYATPDYFDSWWTIAELMTIAYRRRHGRLLPAIHIFDPESKNVRMVRDEEVLPSIDRPTQKRMARIYTNSDPALMDPSVLAPMAFFGSLPLLGRLKYFHDHAFSEKFWFHPLVSCAECRRRESRRAFDLAGFLGGGTNGLVRLTPNDVASAVDRGSWHCPQCATDHGLTTEKTPRFLWWPAKFGRPTGPDGASVTPIPVVRLQETPAQLAPQVETRRFDPQYLLRNG